MRASIKSLVYQHKIFLITIIFVFYGLLSSELAAKESINLTFMFTSGMQRQVYHEISKKFELEYPEYDLKIKTLEQEEYKANAVNLLSNNEEYSDIFFGLQETS